MTEVRLPLSPRVPFFVSMKIKMATIWTSSRSRPSDQNWVLSCYEAKSLDNNKPTVTEIKPELGAIFTILETYDGSIWLEAEDGVYRYDE